MNKLKSLIVLSLMLFLGGQMMGQTGGTFFLGASFPMGDFGEGTELRQTALWGNASQTYGGAALGFNAGLRWDFGVGLKGLAVVLAVDGLYNDANSDIKHCYQERKEDLDVLYDNIQLTTPKYVNVPIMLGLRYTYYVTRKLGFYAEGCAGANIGIITEYAERYNFNEILTDTQLTHRNAWKYATSFAFGWQAGVGIEVSERLVLGCSFYNLGATPVKGEVTYKVGDAETMNTAITNESFEYGTLNPTLLLARIGFRF